MSFDNDLKLSSSNKGTLTQCKNVPVLVIDNLYVKIKSHRQPAAGSSPVSVECEHEMKMEGFIGDFDVESQS